jgi:hypothetical protein
MTRQEVLERLEALPTPLVTAFAAACLERVLPAFERRTGESWGVPHNAVSLAWEALEGRAVSTIRWNRMRSFLQRISVSIEDHGPSFATGNAVAASGVLLSEMFGFASSGDLALDHRERARRARFIAGNAIDAIDALHRESRELDRDVSFASGPMVEMAWQAAALERLATNLEAPPTRSLFDGVTAEGVGTGLDGSHAAWFPWDRGPQVSGPDLTSYVSTHVREPKVTYYVYAANNTLGALGTQATGEEILFLREVVRHEGIARFSYHLRRPELAPWAHYLVYHLVAGEHLSHHFDGCAQIRFRDLDTDERTLVPYPPHALADDDE